LIIIVLGVSTAIAEPTTIEVDAVECTVEIIQPGKEWTDEDNVYHLRGQVVKNVKVSDFALMNGTDIVEINLNLNLMDGSGDGFGSGIFYPDEAAGTFRGIWTGEFNGGVLTGRSVSHGTGELVSIKGEATFEPSQVPCEEGWGPMHFVGVIKYPQGE
jgi:hypothetical protein